MKKGILVLVVLGGLGILVSFFLNASSKEAFEAYQGFAGPRAKDDIITANLTPNSNFRVEGVEYTLESHGSDGAGGVTLVVFQKVGVILSANPALIVHRMRHYVTMQPDGDGWTVNKLEIELLDNRMQHLPGTEIRKVI